jgi:hypothetical protein
MMVTLCCCMMKYIDNAEVKIEDDLCRLYLLRIASRWLIFLVYERLRLEAALLIFGIGLEIDG